MSADSSALPGAPHTVSLSDFIDGHPVATFVIDNRHVVTHWNRACEHLLGWDRADMLGTSNHWKPFYSYARPLLADLIVDGRHDEIHRHYQREFAASAVIPGAYEIEDFFPSIGAQGHWLHFTAAPLYDEHGRMVGAIETLQDVTERRVAENAMRATRNNLEQIVRHRTAELAESNRKLADDVRQRYEAEEALRARNHELTQVNQRLQLAQQQLLQAEKLASIGQLAAGVAHEINNPIGYVLSNFTSLKRYVDQLFQVLDACQGAPGLVLPLPQSELDFLRGDVAALLTESSEGIERVRHIVQDLKDFSRADAQAEWSRADLNRGIDSTLNIVASEIKYKAEVVKEYGELPPVECIPSQLNQVIMNLLVNAAHAIETVPGRITLRTGHDTAADTAWFEVGDTGCGMSPEVQSRIFDPFYTTKAIGKGTGLGLAVSYGIVQKHGGHFEIESSPGAGSRIRVVLPVSRRATEEAENSQ
ncbi:ATP-binding protein [Massilia endophytica]|uniref:ATP-binding protein n=1 Tax=Massilia endophytica TaxID=2899220 RepID=UPI001E3A36A7|nr:ATP-binding protein [Massilia endophytica]UGQ49130.1 ATP-binding protein [Massilia endophytica]